MADAHALLWWLPVGAGGHVVVHTSRWWELWNAVRARRAPEPLFHAVLEVFTGQHRHVIEMGPAWGQRGPVRQVVATGPVGAQALGRWVMFRYEVRCWAEGDIPDREFAVGPPRRISLTVREAADLVARTAEVPTHVWGQDIFGVGDMWNSNSLISWLLQSSGIDARALAPPAPGRAPGWRSGILAAMETERGVRYL
ncbi:hypothetical protein NYP18_07275 [Corynebacterium sp. YIM 101645]|uniref:Uncharacterized protein n=1 Tax=Corynebacterium lemuris TaxID=1859292 RepID=A0ABT2FW43_9CORY|nr:hypothetical protein [Corynebacterium lemuris]MCS5479455.1 hypothetical protein [Corynebacterium lemuris]